MTSQRRGPAPATRREDGRYLRFSWRYASWQVQDKRGAWHNVRVDLARAYSAAGFPVLPDTTQTQGELI